MAKNNEHKHTKDTLREIDAKFALIFEASPNIMSISKAKDGCIVEANDAFVQTFGYERQELLGRTSIELKLWDSPLEMAMISKETQNNGAVRGREVMMQTKAGDRRWLLLGMDTIDIGGEPHFISVASDITKRKLAEKKLWAKEQIFDTSISANSIADPQGIINEVNASFLQLWGFSNENEVLGKNISYFFQSEKMAAEVVEALNKAGVWKGEFIAKKKDGSTFIAHGLATVLRDKNAETIGYQSSVSDITERKRTENKLIDYQKHLKALAWQLSLAEEQERKHIATWIHDEITQDLIAVKMKLSALHNDIKKGDFAVDIEGFKRYVGDLIEKTRVQSFDLSSPVLYAFGLEEAISGYLLDEIQAKHEIITEFEDDGLSKPVDENIQIQLFRSVRELLTNTIKHAQAQKIKVSICKEDDIIKISVKDDGIGFDSRENDISDLIKGFGLFSIHENLNQLGGNAEIKSTMGQGTEVILTAPLKKRG